MTGSSSSRPESAAKADARCRIERRVSHFDDTTFRPSDVRPGATRRSPAPSLPRPFPTEA